MQIKKYLNTANCRWLTAGLFAVASSAFAGGVEPAPVQWGSFYVGAGVDYSTVHSKYGVRQNQFESDLDPQLQFSSVAQANSGGYDQYYANLLFGYQTRSWHRFDLALEAFVTATPRPISNGAWVYSNSTVSDIFEYSTGQEDFQITPTYGIALMPGFQIRPNLRAFARVAYVGAESRLREYASDTFFAGGGVNTTGQTSALGTYDNTQTRTRDGVQLGIGFDMRASEHVVYRSGYYWTNYGTNNFGFTTTDASFAPILLWQTQAWTHRTQIETFTQSIMYYFTPPDGFERGNSAVQGGEFYVGAFGDRDNTVLNQFTHISNPRVRGAAAQNFRNAVEYGTSTPLGWGYELFAGYGYTWANQMYLGLEGFFNGTVSSYRDSTLTTIPLGAAAAANGQTVYTQNRYRLKNMWGLVFTPGYKVSQDLLAFFELGFAQRSVNWRQSYANAPTVLPRETALYNASRSHELWGYQIGLGFDVRLAQNLFLRNEYVLTTYSNAKLPREWACCSAGGFAVGQDYTFGGQSSMYKLGLEYRLPV